MNAADLHPGLRAPLLKLEQQILQRHQPIEHWLRAQWQEHETPFYASVDLRNSGFKLAPVDTNLFPGGFNNLKPEFLPLCVQAAMTAIQKLCPDAKGVLLDPGEPHAQPVLPAERGAAAVDPAHGRHEGARRHADPGDHRSRPSSSCRAAASSRSSRWCGAAIASDCRTSIPAWCCSTTICRPAFPRSWRTSSSRSSRRCSRAGPRAASRSHFAAYSKVAAEFAALIDIDPWLIDPYFAMCGEINFQERTGEECLAG